MPQSTPSEYVKIPRIVLDALIRDAKKIAEMDANDNDLIGFGYPRALGACNAIAIGMVINLETYPKDVK